MPNRSGLQNSFPHRLEADRGVSSSREWITVALCATALVAGLNLAVTVGSLIGPLLVIGAVAGLGSAVFPDIIERTAQFLSTGSLRRFRNK